MVVTMWHRHLRQGGRCQSYQELGPINVQNPGKKAYTSLKTQRIIPPASLKFGSLPILRALPRCLPPRLCKQRTSLRCMIPVSTRDRPDHPIMLYRKHLIHAGLPIICFLLSWIPFNRDKTHVVPGSQ